MKTMLPVTDDAGINGGGIELLTTSTNHKH